MTAVQFPYKKVVSSILLNLQPKGRSVLTRRFGLRGERETLQEIGRSYGITRERVRQIEEFALRALRNQKDIVSAYAPIFSYFQNYFKDHGDLRREELVLEELGAKAMKPHVAFLLAVGGPFARKGETDEMYTIWHADERALHSAKTVIGETVELFEKKGVPVAEQELLSWASTFSKDSGTSLTSQAFLSYVDSSKLIERNPFGEYGLRQFPEIHPRGMRDEAYIVLKRKKTPLHFRAVADEVTKYRKKYLGENETANPQTIHNELIKDRRFVLVGRGMYALNEWGYAPGIVRDVIVRVLGNAGRPLPKEEVVRLVKEQRIVQDNTVFLNLHNKRYFKRTDEGHFTLKA